MIRKVSRDFAFSFVFLQSPQSPLTSYCNNPTQAPSHPPRISGRHSKQFFPSQRKPCRDTSRGIAGLYTTSDSWLFSCVHGCHWHVFTVVLKGVGFTLLILPTERKCHEFNLWYLPLPLLPLFIKQGSYSVFSGNIYVRMDRSNSQRKLGIKQTEN